jgi:hypothetical protein
LHCGRRNILWRQWYTATSCPGDGSRRTADVDGTARTVFDKKKIKKMSSTKHEGKKEKNESDRYPFGPTDGGRERVAFPVGYSSARHRLKPTLANARKGVSVARKPPLPFDRSFAISFRRAFNNREPV